MKQVLRKDLSIFILKEPYIRLASKLPTTYTEEEIKNLISSVDRSTPLGKRNYLILLLASEYGMRASDIRSLSLKHIDWESNTILFNQQKQIFRFLILLFRLSVMPLLNI